MSRPGGVKFPEEIRDGNPIAMQPEPQVAHPLYYGSNSGCAPQPRTGSGPWQ
jgi:hypothetical protein